MRHLALIAIAVSAFAQTAKFPAAVATDDALKVVKNRVQSSLIADVNVNDNVLIVKNGAGFVANMLVTIDDKSGTTEIVSICQAVGNILTVGSSGSCPDVAGRASDGTAAIAHSAGAIVSAFVDAWHHNALAAEVKAIEGALGANLSNVATAAQLGAVETALGWPGLTNVAPAGAVDPNSNPTWTGNHTFSGGSVIASASAKTAPVRIGVNDPATCDSSVREQFFNTTSNKLKICTLDNVWTVVSGSSSTPSLNAVDYTFSQAPGGSLSIGVNIITLTPCPLGVNGTDTNHFVYISGGTGTADAAAISGGTCTSGASTGTVAFSVAHTHSGAWTIQSATGGLQEVLQLLSTTGGKIEITVPTTLHAMVSVVGSADVPGVIIEGQGLYTPSLIRAADYPAGDLISYDAPVMGFAAVLIQNLSILNAGPYGSRVHNTAGAAIHFRGVTGLPCSIRSVTIDSGYVGVDIEGCSNIVVDDVSYMSEGDYAASYAALAGFNIRTSAGLLSCFDLIFSNISVTGYAPTAAHTVTNGILLQSSDGVTIRGAKIGGSQRGITVSVTTGSYINLVDISDCLIDYFQLEAIYISGDGGVPTSVTGLRFMNNHISTEYPNAGYNHHGIFFDANSYATKIQIENNRITFNGLSGIAFSSSMNPVGNSEIEILGNDIFDNNLSNTSPNSGVYFAGNWANVTVGGGNHIYNSALGGKQVYGVYAPGTLTDWLVEGNNLSNVTGATAQTPLSLGSLVRGVVGSNSGVDDTIGTVASGSTMALPINPTVTVSGTTGVGTITGLREGRHVALITTDGAVTFTAGATIGNTITSTQNVPLFGVVQSGKLYLR